MKKILTIISMTILILLFDKVKADTWGNGLISTITCNSDQCELLNNAPTIYGVSESTNGSKKTYTTFTQYRFNDYSISNNNEVQFQIYIAGISSYQNEPQINVTAYLLAGSGQTWCTSIVQNVDSMYYTLTCPIKSGSTSINGLDLTVYYAWGQPTSGIVKNGISPLINLQYNSTQDIINNQNQNTQEIINQNATYSDTPTKDMTNETRELESYEQAEQSLINSLDLNMSVLDGITINPNASSYIWQIVNKLRTINPAIILLMTSILGMGIIKMVLNR